MEQHFLFFVPPDQIMNDRLRFSEEEARHIAKVLRIRPGEVVQVTDGVGRTMDVRLLEVDKKRASGDIIASCHTPAEPDRILAMGVIRQRERLEFAVEKAVELGVTRIVLVHSDHAGKMEIKPTRIEKTIVSAMKQSRRPWLPGWEERGSFNDVLAAYRDSRTIIMADSSTDGTYRWKPDDDPMLLMVGPEGGFSPHEVEQARACGAQIIRLGNKRLRTETAVCALLALANQR